MYELSRIVRWSAVIVMGLAILFLGPRPAMFDWTPTTTDLVHIASVAPIASAVAAATPLSFGYFEVPEGCGPSYEGECLNVRTGPGLEYPVVFGLRSGAVLAFNGVEERGGMRWLKVAFNEWLRYSDRLPNNLYVAEAYVRALAHEG